MAVRKTAQKDQSKPTETTGDVIEKKLVAFAGQLGYLVGTVQARAEGWLDREALTKEVARIRDSAANLLEQMNREGTAQRQAAAKKATTASARVAKQTTAPAPPPAPAASAAPARPSRGAVDAPGKRHRQPPPRESIDKRMGEPVGKQMGQKSMKNRGRSGRG